MATLECPNGHMAVVRNDPKSTGYRAMCDTCGWSAQKVVARGDRNFSDNELAEESEKNHGLLRAQEEEQSRRLPSEAASSRRRND